MSLTLFYWHIYYIYRLRFASYEVVNRKPFPKPCRQSTCYLLVGEIFANVFRTQHVAVWNVWDISVSRSQCTTIEKLSLYCCFCISCVSYLYILLFQILITTAQCALLQTLPALSVCRHEYSFVRHVKIFFRISKNKKSFYREFSAKMLWSDPIQLSMFYLANTSWEKGGFLHAKGLLISAMAIFHE